MTLLVDVYSLGTLDAECAYTMTIGINQAHLPLEYGNDRAVLEVTFLSANGDIGKLWFCVRLCFSGQLLLSNWTMMRRDAKHVSCTVEPCHIGQIHYTANCFWKRVFDGPLRVLHASTGALGHGQVLCATELQVLMYNKVQ